MLSQNSLHFPDRSVQLYRKNLEHIGLEPTASGRNFLLLPSAPPAFAVGNFLLPFPRSCSAQTPLVGSALS
jgi:hypothetical protein